MSAVNRAALEALVNTYLLEGGKRTTAEGVKTVLRAMVESLVALINDKNANDGFLGIDSSGKVDISKIKQDTPTGLFAKDDGSWATTTSSSIAGVAITTGDINDSDSILTAFGKILGKLRRAAVASSGAEMDPFGSYITNDPSSVSLALPSSAIVGDRFYVIGKGAGGWRITQKANQIIRYPLGSTTLGVTGYIESSNRYDCIEVMCITDSTDFIVVNHTGTLTIA
jgi:hypothetical protein